MSNILNSHEIPKISKWTEARHLVRGKAVGSVQLENTWELTFKAQIYGKPDFTVFKLMEMFLFLIRRQYSIMPFICLSWCLTDEII